jgi:hypothetical protein
VVSGTSGMMRSCRKYHRKEEANLMRYSTMPSDDLLRRHGVEINNRIRSSNRRCPRRLGKKGWLRYGHRLGHHEVMQEQGAAGHAFSANISRKTDTSNFPPSSAEVSLRVEKVASSGIGCELKSIHTMLLCNISSESKEDSRTLCTPKLHLHQFPCCAPSSL